MDGWIDWIVGCVVAMAAIILEKRFPFKVKSRWLRVTLIVVLSLASGIATAIILYLIEKNIAAQ